MNEHLFAIYNEGDIVHETICWPKEWRVTPYPLQPVEEMLPRLRLTLQELEANVVGCKPTALYLPAHLLLLEKASSIACGGLELFKHIRLSSQFPHLTSLPILIGLDGKLENYLRQAADNALLLSPGCRTLFLPSPVHEWRRMLNSIERLSASELRKAISPYVIFTDTDNASKGHLFRNRVGVSKFLQEFAGSVLPKGDSVLQEAKQAVEDGLWLKKMRFLNPELEPETGLPFDAAFHEKCRDRQFVLVDDQFRIGWGYGLYAGLFLDEARNKAQKEESTKDLEKALLALNDTTQAYASLNKDNAQLFCLQSYAEAKNFFGGHIRKQFDEHVQLWKQADEAWFHAKKEDDKKIAIEKIEKTETAVLSHTFRPSVLFLDLRLTPGDEKLPPERTSGMQLLQFIKSEKCFPYLPVVIMTASEKATGLKEADVAGADGFWIKGESTGRQLQTTVNMAFKLSELLVLWKKVQMLRSKNTFQCVEFIFENFRKDYPPSQRLRQLWKVPPQGAIKKVGNNEIEQRKVDRDQALNLLSTSLELLRLAIIHEEGGTRHTSLLSGVVVNLGLVQEIRYVNLKWATAYAREAANKRDLKQKVRKEFIQKTLSEMGLDNNEQTLNQLRGDTVHYHTGGKVPLKIVIDLFDKTLNWLLSNS